MKTILKNLIVNLLVSSILLSAPSAAIAASPAMAPVPLVRIDENIVGNLITNRLPGELDRLTTLNERPKQNKFGPQAYKGDTENINTFYRVVFLIFSNIAAQELQRRSYQQHLALTTADAHKTTEEVVNDVTTPEALASILVPFGMSLGAVKVWTYFFHVPFVRGWLIDWILATGMTVVNSAMPQIISATAGYILKHPNRVGSLNASEIKHIKNIINFKYPLFYLFYGKALNKDPDLKSAYSKVLEALKTYLWHNESLTNAIFKNTEHELALSGSFWAIILTNAMTGAVEKSLAADEVSELAIGSKALSLYSKLKMKNVRVFLFSAFASSVFPNVLKDGFSQLLRESDAGTSYFFQQQQDKLLISKLITVTEPSEVDALISKNIVARQKAREHRLQLHLSMIYQALDQVNYHTLELRHIESLWSKPKTLDANPWKSFTSTLGGFFDFGGTANFSSRYAYSNRTVKGYTEIFEKAAAHAVMVYEHEDQTLKYLASVVQSDQARRLLSAEDDRVNQIKEDWLQPFIYELRNGLKVNAPDTPYTGVDQDYRKALDTLGNSIFWSLDEPTILTSLAK
jgi:hypothetical protein